MMMMMIYFSVKIEIWVVLLYSSIKHYSVYRDHHHHHHQHLPSQFYPFSSLHSIFEWSPLCGVVVAPAMAIVVVLWAPPPRSFEAEIASCWACFYWVFSFSFFNLLCFLYTLIQSNSIEKVEPATWSCTS